MKLYFYMLETPKEGQITLRIEQCEARESSGLLRPEKGKFFPPAIGGFTLECHIGKVSGKKDTPVVILKEPDLKQARQLLAEHARYWLTHYQKMVESWQCRLNVVEGRKA